MLVDFSKDENEDRGNWTGRLDFVLSCLGCAVGLGNVWRFPYLCYKNGGAVFLIPYVIMLALVGIPIFFLELSVGQFTSSSPLTCWGMAPVFKGIGYAMIAVSSLVSIYYNIIISWAIFYFFASFTSDLPWQHCDREYATPYCRTFLNGSITEERCTDMGLLANTTIGVCFNGSTPVNIFNTTLAALQSPPIKAVLPSEEYLNGYVLGKYFSEGIHDLGPVRWQMALCLLLAWTIVFFSLVKGVKSSGKVVYFTALFPYVVLVILFVRGLLLEGHYQGIEFYIMKPDFSKLKSATVWKDAAVQIFFSLSAAWGGLITLSSYNRFHNNCLRDALIVSISNCLTSFFAGFVIFSFLGFLAFKMDTTVDKVVDGGIGLAFVVYPDAVARMPGVPTLWALLFFLMLITLGLDSEFALVETISTSIMDQWVPLRKKKSLVILCLCVVFYLLGLTMCTNGGAFLLQLMDSYAAGWNVLLIAIAECIVIAYVYGLFCGLFRFKEDIRIMIGDRPFYFAAITWDRVWPWWAFCWYGVTPLLVAAILVFSWVDYKPTTYGLYTYPAWAEAIGWLMTLTVVVALIAPGIIIALRAYFNGKPIRELFLPNRCWGPALPKHRKLMSSYLRTDQFVVDPHSEDAVLEAGPVKVSDSDQ
ncbi:hypothetical protein NP493_1414g01000 [Ridgeia piscesae]|uniref:Transporter n=1 Tax=Ridgeia piscesae TaxID=27915 RepID=A0AAD9K435_RIDPI|nr:hypothetical protein NP493_1414g01000 [Ridgeia piscesae]